MLSYPSRFALGVAHAALPLQIEGILDAAEGGGGSGGEEAAQKQKKRTRGTQC